MIFKDSYGDRLRVDVGRDLSGATAFEMIITKPSGTVMIKTATQYDSTHITYTTIEGDIDESGIYTITPRVQWGTDSKLPGDTAYLEVIEIGDISPTQVIGALSAYTFIDSVQTADEYNTTLNTDAEILYPQFAILLRKARGDLTKELAKFGAMELSLDDELAAICYLIADTQARRNPTWSAKSLSSAPGESISRSDPRTTDYRKNLDSLLITAAEAANGSAGILAPDDDGEILVHDDETNLEAVKDLTYDPTEDSA